MTSGNTPRPRGGWWRAARLPALLLLAWLPGLLGATEDAERTRAVIAALAQPVPSSTVFAEQRASGLLDAPMLLRGTLSRPDADHLVRTVTEPYAETSELSGEQVTLTRESGEVRRFAIRRAPALATLRDGLQALLAGDADALEERFQVAAAHDGAAWRLVLAPRDARVARQISRLEAVGLGEHLRCLRTHEAGGAVTELLLGEPAQAEMPDFEAVCDGHGGETDAR